MSSREAFFECTYTSAAGEYELQVRAWSASEAESLFREALESAGVKAPGALLIFGPRGYARRATFAPASQEAAAP
jgi:hypothetical protein